MKLKVITKKWAHNGKKKKIGFTYFVEVTDGKKSIHFSNDLKENDTLNFNTIGYASNEYGNKYYFINGEIHQLISFGEYKEPKKRKEELKSFIGFISKFNIKTEFAAEPDTIKEYFVEVV